MSIGLFARMLWISMCWSHSSLSLWSYNILPLCRYILRSKRKAIRRRMEKRSAWWSWIIAMVRWIKIRRYIYIYIYICLWAHPSIHFIPFHPNRCDALIWFHFIWIPLLMYVGGWSEGKRNGFGRFIFPDGTIYRGHWKDDCRDGQGNEQDLSISVPTLFPSSVSNLFINC